LPKRLLDKLKPKNGRSGGGVEGDSLIAGCDDRLKPSWMLLTFSGTDAVATWRMGISKFALQQDKPGVYSADAGDGSRGSVEVCYSTPKDTLIYCTGAFKSPLLPKPIVAKSLMRLQVKFDKRPAADDRHALGDVFVGAVADRRPWQTISPIKQLVRIAISADVLCHMMSIAMSANPAGKPSAAHGRDFRTAGKVPKLSATCGARQRKPLTR
jgi:hypothetical protein